ncbi:MAG: rubrerythrin [Candidatus Eisenbacteria bacterium]|nr:rubrerythrin [Candidatus Eisenbacteria bacterium]
MAETRFSEIIDFAIQKEQEAVDTYSVAAEMVKRSNVRDMLLSLARQEEGHKRRLLEVQAGEASWARVDEVPDLRIADYTDSVQISPDMDYQDVLTVAMKREEKAHNLYQMLASNATEPELKELFANLAHEESRHKLALEREYDEHVLTDN